MAGSGAREGHASTGSLRLSSRGSVLVWHGASTETYGDPPPMMLFDPLFITNVVTALYEFDCTLKWFTFA